MKELKIGRTTFILSLSFCRWGELWNAEGRMHLSGKERTTYHIASLAIVDIEGRQFLQMIFLQAHLMLAIDIKPKEDFTGVNKETA